MGTTLRTFFNQRDKRTPTIALGKAPSEEYRNYLGFWVDQCGVRIDHYDGQVLVPLIMVYLIDIRRKEMSFVIALRAYQYQEHVTH